MATLKDLLVNGNSSLLGTTTAVDILPQTDANYDLGSTDLGWKTIYLANTTTAAYDNGLRLYNNGTLMGSIGVDSAGIGIYGNGNVYIRPVLNAATSGFTVTSTAIVPAANNTINLGQHSTTKYRWKNIYLQGVLDYIMDANTSNAKTQLVIKDTGNTSIAEIGFHNTGDTNGAFYIVPAFKNNTGNSYNGQNGLYIGKNNLKWENKYVLRYSATATTNQLIIADGAAGNVKTSGKTITTNAPTSSSDDTTIPTSAAVWSAVDALTDTKNTAGSTDTSSKIYLIGATSQATNPQTYSDNEVFVTSGVLDAKEVSTSKLYIYGNKTTNKTNRFLYSDTLTNIYASVDGVIPLVITNAEVRRGASAITINLGSSSYPWHNTYTETLSISDTTNATKSNSSTFAALDVEGGAQIAKTLAAKSIIIDNNAATNCTLQYDETLQTLKFVFV